MKIDGICVHDSITMIASLSWSKSVADPWKTPVSASVAEPRRLGSSPMLDD